MRLERLFKKEVGGLRYREHVTGGGPRFRDHARELGRHLGACFWVITPLTASCSTLDARAPAWPGAVVDSAPTLKAETPVAVREGEALAEVAWAWIPAAIRVATR